MKQSIFGTRNFPCWHLLEARELMLGIILVLPFGSLLLLGFTSAAWAEYKGESKSIIGNIEQVSMQNDGRLLIKGWGLDVNGKGAPVVVISVYDENIVFVETASGGRDDITKAYPLATTENVVIAGTSLPVACKMNQKLITMAANSSGEFAIIGRNKIEGCPY